MATIPLLPDALRQRLEGITAEMRGDSFFRDMAKPITAGLVALRDEADAFDRVSARSCRDRAIACLEESAQQLGKAAENKLFVAEHEVVVAALSHLKGEDDAEAKATSVELSTAPSQLQATSEQAAMVKALQAGQVAASGTPVALATTPNAPPALSPSAPPEAVAPVLASEVLTCALTASGFEAPSPPYTWDQDADGGVIVSIPVPSSCQKKDVAVSFKPTHLLVTVRGHPVEKVIDADLLYRIESSACSWGLEGSGAKRVLALQLEKANEGEKWVSLLDDEKGRSNKDISGMLGGMGLEQWTPGHTA